MESINIEFLNLKKNPYFSVLVLKHSNSFDIRNEEFKKEFLKYLVEYTEMHWSIITDFLTEKNVSKLEAFNKSFEDFKFTSNYLNSFFMGFIDDEFGIYIKRLKKYLEVPEVKYTSTKDFYINEEGEEIIRKGPFELLEQNVKLSPESSRVLFLVNYNEWFIDKLKQAYIFNS